MKKQLFTKDNLIKYLLIVSIITITLMGLYYLNLLTSSLLQKLSSAISAVLVPFAIAFFLSFIVGPIATWLQKKLKFNRTISIIISIFLGIVFVLFILVITIVFVVTQVSAILNSLIQLIDNQSLEQMFVEVLELINLYIQNNNMTQVIEEIINNGATVEKIMGLLGTVFISMSRILSSIVSIILISVLTPVFMYYLISEKEYIFMSIAKVVPEKGRVHVIELGKRTDEVIRKFFKGQGMMIGIIFIYFAITLSLLSLTMSRFDISHALIFALLMGMLNIIPYLGAWIGLSAPLIFLLTIHLDLQSQLLGSNLYIYGMIGVIVIFFIEQLLEMSIIQPTVLGKQVHIHPLLVLSSLIFFGGLFGFVGVLLAVPLAATLKVVFEYIKEVNTPVKVKSKVKKEKEVAELNVVDSAKE